MYFLGVLDPATDDSFCKVYGPEIEKFRREIIERGLHRLNYTTNDQGKFGVEYADILGIPF